MARTSTRDLLDRIMGGGLREMLQERRTPPSPVPFDLIARELADRFDWDGTGETVRQWCREYGINTARHPKEAA